jgi:RHH-type transcriptional regulator, rel operon repressor / antitoxin RelB
MADIVKLDPETISDIDALAAEIRQSREAVVREAIKAFREMRDWQRAHVEEGLRQADAGEFASPRDVKAAFGRWRN